MNRHRGGAGGLLLLLSAVLFLITPARAQTPQGWPQRNVQFILTFGPGSATDIAARLIGAKLQAKWGKGVVVENRAGGDGLIAIRSFLLAKDDHVLLYASSATFIAHPYTLTSAPPYDLYKDFAPVARVADTLATISTPTGLNVSSLEEWVKLARSSPGKLNAAGAAGVPELHLTAYLKDNDLDVVKVPYRDVVQAGRDLADSRLQLRVSSYGVAQPHVEAGRLRILALGASKRSQIAPTIASAVEAGYPVLSMETTTGLYGPPSMPLELRERIAADVMETIADPTVSQRLRDTGQAPRPGGPEAMIATLKQQETAAAAAAKIARIEARR